MKGKNPMKINQIKKFYDATGMHPYEVDQHLLDKDAKNLLRHDEKGNISGINLDSYVEGLKKLVAPPKKSDDNLLDIQMRNPDGYWVTFEISLAHHYINECNQKVELRMWKGDKYIGLDSSFVNEGLKNKPHDDLNNICFLMPRILPEVEVKDMNEEQARESFRKCVEHDRKLYREEGYYSSLREKVRMGGHL